MSQPLPSQTLSAALHVLRERVPDPPEVALVLGSGLGTAADAFTERVAIEYGDLPDMPTSAVVGHAGRFSVGRLGGRRVIAMQGRVHLYEGYTAEQVVFGVRLMLLLGARTLIVTNAAGGIRGDLTPGTLMLIEDHINLTGHNSLRGRNDDALGPRFPDMSAAYDHALLEHATRLAVHLSLSVARGVYAGMLGPNYETPAEIRMLRTLGADAVGMSTVLETIAARHMGARVLGVSCITNQAAGLSSDPLTHADVERTALRTRDGFTRLLEAVVSEVPR